MGHLCTTKQGTPAVPCTSWDWTGHAADSVGKPSPQNTIIDNLDMVLAAVERVCARLETMRTSLESKMDAVALNLTLLYADHTNFSDRVHAAEITLEELQPKASALEIPLTKMEERVQMLENHVDDAEGLSYHNNI
ncbi:hypothetical protein NDU88_003750 [Pleurodeles waltl]|uniref:Uncharacterized protein n=1 Tax=Pleurodeles waltl TaxID=8319 RepID=A0AAV7RJF1_PLEWA|nr:hypothetical protein NDU88_003750 [Pleurodeles waltl]